MEEYKPNSHKYKEDQKEASERKKLDKVITGNAKVRKKSEIRKFTDLFVSEDIHSVKSYVVRDVIVPNIKDLLYDIVTGSLKMFMFGDSARGSRHYDSNDRFRPAYVSYNNYSSKRDSHYHGDSRARIGYNPDDIVLENRGDAEEVLSQMDGIIETYGMVSVGDLYDLVGKSSNYTDMNYGWTNLRNAEPVRVRDGYLLKMPKVTPLKK